MATLDDWLFPLKLISALGCGLIAGVFFAFSSFVMKAFARLPPGEGLAAMQSVNRAVLNPVFLGVFVGTAAACFLAVAYSLFHWQKPGAGYLLAGGLLYLVGSFLVTMVFNVPRNEALDLIAPGDPNAASLWAIYLTSWTAWNHVRTAASLAAAAAFTIALRY